MHPKDVWYLGRLAQSGLSGAQMPRWRDLIREDLRGLLVDLRPDAPDLVDLWLRASEAASGERAGDDLQQAAGGVPIEAEALAASLDAQTRREAGIYLTPRALADGMAVLVDGVAGEAVLDLSAGAATLLCAAIRRAPQLVAVGVEQNPLMALAAAINLVVTRRALGQRPHPQDRIYLADGLSADTPWCEWLGRAAAVLGNPPYLREKGRREYFQALRARHAHLEEHFCARMDLQYLFFHRSLEFLRPGARLIFVTSTYWLSATHARGLRAELAARLQPEALVRVEKCGVFGDAPGQHTLVSVFRRASEPGAGEARAELGCDASALRAVSLRAVSLVDEPRDWCQVLCFAAGSGGSEPPDGAALFLHDPGELSGANWSVFVPPEAVRRGNWLRRYGTPLVELLTDRQGFVSGADRFSASHVKHYSAGAPATAGAPIFLFSHRDEVPRGLRGLGAAVVRPVLRASQIEANRVYFVPPGDEVVLYLDGVVAAQNEHILSRHLGQFRPILERRREVKSGIMPWYRLHWPRSRAEQTGPKLVVARRHDRPCFALDLSASAVSSDCTYLVARELVRGGGADIWELIQLMVALNSSISAEYLRHFGKSKGKQLEFYAEPLRTLPLPLYRDKNKVLRWVEAPDVPWVREARGDWEATLDAIRRDLEPILRAAGLWQDAAPG